MLSLKEICILLYSLLEIIILLHMVFWNQRKLIWCKNWLKEFIGGVFFITTLIDTNIEIFILIDLDGYFECYL